MNLLEILGLLLCLSMLAVIRLGSIRGAQWDEAARMTYGKRRALMRERLKFNPRLDSRRDG